MNDVVSQKPELTKAVYFEPAYDKRSKKPSENYGIHGVNILFTLSGPEGVVQFLIFTNWHLPHVQAEMDAKPLAQEAFLRYINHKPSPADLGYHSRRPMWPGHEPITQSCEHLDGCPCYYEGSGTAAEPIFQVLLEEGSDGVWRELKAYYRQTFIAQDAA